jgi:hypothetical protein
LERVLLALGKDCDDATGVQILLHDGTAILQLFRRGNWNESTLTRSKGGVVHAAVDALQLSEVDAMLKGKGGERVSFAEGRVLESKSAEQGARPEGAVRRGALNSAELPALGEEGARGGVRAGDGIEGF